MKTEHRLFLAALVVVFSLIGGALAFDYVNYQDCLRTNVEIAKSITDNGQAVYSLIRCR
jgi:hypothetical protein